MILATRRLHDVLINPYVSFFGSVASIAGLFWVIFDKLYTPSAGSSAYDIWKLIVLVVAAIIFIATGFYSFRVRQENRAFRNATEQLHNINHDYRNVLCKMFRGDEPVTDDAELAKEELFALQSVCQRTAKIFNWFTHGDCMVTVKLITKLPSGVSAKTHARSENLSARDTWEPKAYLVKVGLNTAFDKAIGVSPGRISHFFSPDLTKERDYQNQRPYWDRFYRSAIVVPIRYVNPDKIGQDDASDDIGFLSVDTMSPNRLNDGFHLYYLAALADQMYNFMSLMRGRYKVKATKGQ